MILLIIFLLIFSLFVGAAFAILLMVFFVHYFLNLFIVYTICIECWIWSIFYSTFIIFWYFWVFSGFTNLNQFRFLFFRFSFMISSALMFFVFLTMLAVYFWTEMMIIIVWKFLFVRIAPLDILNRILNTLPNQINDHLIPSTISPLSITLIWIQSIKLIDMLSLFIGDICWINIKNFILSLLLYWLSIILFYNIRILFILILLRYHGGWIIAFAARLFVVLGNL